VRIPKRYQQEPVISNLISDHGLTVNISAALLSANAREDGWFDLQLQGAVPCSTSTISIWKFGIALTIRTRAGKELKIASNAKPL
jgi:hypothetical protein